MDNYGELMHLNLCMIRRSCVAQMNWWSRWDRSCLVFRILKLIIRKIFSIKNKEIIYLNNFLCLAPAGCLLQTVRIRDLQSESDNGATLLWRTENEGDTCSHLFSLVFSLPVTSSQKKTLCSRRLLVLNPATCNACSANLHYSSNSCLVTLWCSPGTPRTRASW